PHVAGAWALLKSAKPTATVSEVLAALQNGGLPITDARNGITKSLIQLGYDGTTLGALGILLGHGNVAPSVSILSPATGATFTAPANVSISAAAGDPDGGISKVEYFAGATKIFESSVVPYSFTWTNVPAGSYVLTAKATDVIGGTAVSAPVNISVTVISVTYQISGSVTSGGSPLAGVNLAASGGAACTVSNTAGQYNCTVPQGYTGSITPSLSGYSFTPPSRSYNNVNANQSVQNYTAALNADTVWVDDAVPAGSTASGPEGWNWVSSNPAPFSGSVAHRSAITAGMHQHLFINATTTLSVGAGDTLFAYVYLDPANPPSEVMLQWNDGNWEHRAYWGANAINWGIDGTANRRFMGPLPPLGQWVKLEVPAALVGLAGRVIHGMAFTLFNGRATWDYAGKQ
ncbi:MAG TPA: Ig-like domain-containing protein, partial [Burkholderiales bacterium]|nr:Ig-like domain-containing protein [Burkholderiales bacterium]